MNICEIEGKISPEDSRNVNEYINCSLLVLKLCVRLCKNLVLHKFLKFSHCFFFSNWELNQNSSPQPKYLCSVRIRRCFSKTMKLCSGRKWVLCSRTLAIPCNCRQKVTQILVVCRLINNIGTTDQPVKTTSYKTTDQLRKYSVCLYFNITWKTRMRFSEQLY